jgi:hypothetical protein
MAIFFSTGFEEVHPLFKPPVEPPQPTAAEVAAIATVQTHALPLLQQQPPEKQRPGHRTRQHRRASSGEPHHSPPSSAPPAGMPSQSGWPSVAASLAPAVAPSSACAFLSPVLWRNAVTVQASGDRPRATLQGNDPRCFVPPMRPVEDEQHRGNDDAATATADASSALDASSFLTELAPATSLPALQSLVDLLLFHAHFPTCALHEALHRCLLYPLQQRFLDSNREFMRTIMHRCGLNYVSGPPRFFCFSSSVLCATQR